MMSDKLLCINTSKPDAGISQFATNSDDRNRRGGMHTPTKTGIGVICDHSKIINVFSYEYPVTLRMIDGWPLFTRINLTNIWDAKVVSDQHPELMGYKLTTHPNQQISLVATDDID